MEPKSMAGRPADRPNLFFSVDHCLREGYEQQQSRPDFPECTHAKGDVDAGRSEGYHLLAQKIREDSMGIIGRSLGAVLILACMGMGAGGDAWSSEINVIDITPVSPAAYEV